MMAPLSILQANEHWGGGNKHRWKAFLLIRCWVFCYGILLFVFRAVQVAEGAFARPRRQIDGNKKYPVV
jgi:hypothetical protein